MEGSFLTIFITSVVTAMMSSRAASASLPDGCAFCACATPAHAKNAASAARIIDREQALTILNESAALYAVVSSAAMECAVQPAARPQSQTKTRLHPHHEAARCGCARR